MFTFLKKQQYFYWIPNIYFFFSYRKTKYSRSWMYSLLWSNILNKLSNALKFESFMAIYIPKNVFSDRLFIQLKLEEDKHAFFKLLVKQIHLKKICLHLYNDSTYSPKLFQYWLAFFFDEMMYNVPSKSIVKVMLKIFFFMKRYSSYKKYSKFKNWKDIYIHLKRLNKLKFVKHKKKYRGWKIKFVRKSDFLIKKLRTFSKLFLGLQPRRFKNKTIKQFNVRKSFKYNLNINRGSDYLKYQLTLFFITNFDMSLKSARLIFNRYRNSESLTYFKDLFFLLTKKIDFFLKHLFSFSKHEVNLLINTKSIMLNDVKVLDSNTFIQDGDFLYFYKKNNHSHLNLNSNIYSYLNLNILDKVWFYFFFFLSNLFLLSATFYQLSTEKWFMSLFTRISNYNNKWATKSNKTTNYFLFDLKCSYLEIIKGLSAYLLKVSKQTINYWHAETWYCNIFIVKAKTYNLMFSYIDNIYTLKRYSRSIILSINKKIVSLNLIYCTLYNVKSILLKAVYFGNFNFVKDLSGKRTISLKYSSFINRWSSIRYEKKKSRNFFYKKKSSYKLNLDSYKLYKNIYFKNNRYSYTIKSFNKNLLNSIVKLCQGYIKYINIFLNNKSIAYKLIANFQCYTIFENELLFKNVYKFKSIHSFLYSDDILYHDMFLKKTNSFSYWWCLYTGTLKKQFVMNYGYKYFSIKKKHTYRSFLWFTRVYKNDLTNKYKLFYSSFYYNFESYQFPDLYFESRYGTKLDLYDLKHNFFYSEYKYLVSNFYTNINLYKSNNLIQYKNIIFIYKLLDLNESQYNYSKWFTNFNLYDFENEVISNYI